MKSKILMVVLDSLSVLLVFLPWIILQLIASPFRRGFFCDDESIKYPLHSSTVSNTALTSTALILSFVMFVVIEAVHCRTRFQLGINSTQLSRFQWKRYVLAVYSIYLMFLFGLAVQQTLTNIGKYSIGRLRPHFLAACNPDLSLLNCTSSDNVYKYVNIDDSVCTNPNKHVLKDARMSFPSGHSSNSTYVAVFLALYLQVRLTWKGSRLLRHFLQALLIYLAFFVCLSRVSDYKHHWSDVLFGAIIGVSVASITSIHVANKYRKQARDESETASSGTGTVREAV